MLRGLWACAQLQRSAKLVQYLMGYRQVQPNTLAAVQMARSSNNHDVKRRGATWPSLWCTLTALSTKHPGLDGHLRRTEDREAGRPEALGQRGQSREL